MELHFNATKESRKAMVEAISKELGIKAKYLGVPSCAYQVGDYRIEKDGTLIFENENIEESSKVIDACVMVTGVTPSEWEQNTEPEETAEIAEPAEGESTGLTVSLPLDKVMVGNLTRLLEVKGQLIKKALGISELPIEVGEDTISFPWFTRLPDADTARVYTNFIAALCKMSKEQKRITASEKEVENEKYAFRCFLLRLGFIGAEYKTDRKILLQNLSGSSAFKSGAKKGGEEA